MQSELVNHRIVPSAINPFWGQKTLQDTATIKHLKTGVWIYIYLLIFEGALRKWVLPGLATPLLVVRDPVALWAIITALNKNLIKLNGYIITIVVIGLFSFTTAITLGHGNVVVALFGLRIYAIHFPFMFVIAGVFDRSDVIKAGKVLVIISIFMAVLIGLQFFSPQSAWVNRGIGGDESGGGFSGALGYLRPPGTFSFTNGNTVFFSLVSAYIFYFWLNIQKINKLILLAATFALVAAIPLSISRSLLFTVIITSFFALVSSAVKPKLFGYILGAGIGIVVLLAVLSQLSFFQTATEAFTYRLETATESEGGYQGVFLDRYLGGLIRAFSDAYRYPFFGFGIGLSSNVGTQVFSGTGVRLIAEAEWSRTVGEQGILLGLIVIIVRVAFSADLLIQSYRLLNKGNTLSWMLIGFGLTIIPQGLWSQPTALGFSTITGGLILASFNEPA